jgi:GNAT superfamily N-acetyltransferase
VRRRACANCHGQFEGERGSARGATIGQVVGFTVLANNVLMVKKEIQLIFLYVSSSHRRKGITFRLFSAVSELARDRIEFLVSM